MFVYVIGSPKGPQKIGIAVDPERRRRQLQCGHPFPLDVRQALKVDSEAEARAVERIAHKSLKGGRLNGEWFEVSSEVAIRAVEESLLTVRTSPVEARRILMITAAQIRAARALIGWKQTDLAVASGLSEMSIKNIERDVTDPRASTLLKIQEALEAAGVVFLDPGVHLDGGHGLRLRR